MLKTLQKHLSELRIKFDFIYKVNLYLLFRTGLFLSFSFFKNPYRPASWSVTRSHWLQQSPLITRVTPQWSYLPGSRRGCQLSHPHLSNDNFYTRKKVDLKTKTTLLVDPSSVRQLYGCPGASVVLAVQSWSGAPGGAIGVRLIDSTVLMRWHGHQSLYNTA